MVHCIGVVSFGPSIYFGYSWQSPRYGVGLWSLSLSLPARHRRGGNVEPSLMFSSLVFEPFRIIQMNAPFKLMTFLRFFILFNPSWKHKFPSTHIYINAKNVRILTQKIKNK